MNYVITVAHGTIFRFRLLELLRALVWPRTCRRWLRPRRSALELRERAPWLAPQSPLRARLAELGGAGQVRVYPFLWSGRNGVPDRTAAAARLRRKVEARVRRFPDARHFVIAHSHGGNVVLYAMRDSPLMRSHLAGVVCLSTPFLHARRRDMSDVTAAWVASGGTLFLALMAAVHLASPEGGLTRGWGSVAAATAALAAVGAVVVLSRRFAAKVLREASLPDTSWSWRESGGAGAGAGAGADEAGVPLLTIRAPADEASVTLAAAEFLLWTANGLWTHPWRLMRTISTRFLEEFDTGRRRSDAGELWRGAFLWLVGLSGTWIWWRGGPSVEAPSTVVALLPLVVAGSGLAAVVLSLAGLYLWPTMLFLLWPLAALCLWPFGGQLAIAAPFVEMHVGWSPPGLSESVLLTHGTRKGGLAHSASYQDPRALDLLVAWLTRNRSETARGSG